MTHSHIIESKENFTSESRKRFLLIRIIFLFIHIISASTNDDNAKLFLQEFWDSPVPTGKFRYYNAVLYMMVSYDSDVCFILIISNLGLYVSSYPKRWCLLKLNLGLKLLLIIVVHLFSFLPPLPPPPRFFQAFLHCSGTFKAYM